MKRPDLLRMLDNLDTFDILIFTRLDRFSRNVLQANKMVEIMDEYNVAIKSIEEDDIDTSTADGRFNFNLRVSLAQREAEKTSERIKSIFEFLPITVETSFIVISADIALDNLYVDHIESS